MDIIDHGHPHCHSHEMALMDHVKRSIAASYTSLLSRIDSHIEDNRPHVSLEEKDYWDNKADKDQIRDLELRLSDKADFCDVAEIKETLALIKAKMKSKCEEQNLFLTAEDLALYLDDIKRRLKNLEDKDIQGLLSQYLKIADLDYEIAKLNKYATKEWVLSQLLNNSGNKVSYSPQITESTPNSYAIGTLYIDNQPYNIRGVDTQASSNTTVGSFGYSPNTDVSSLTTTQGRYTIGTIKLNGQDYTLYGKDNTGSSSNGQNGNDGNDGQNGNDGTGGDVITNINNRINEIRTDIDALNLWLTDKIKSDISGMIADLNSFKNALNNGDITLGEAFGQSNFGQAIAEYLLLAGVLTQKQDGSYEATYTSIVQNAEEINLAANNIRELFETDSNGNLVLKGYDALRADVITAIKDDEALASLITEWAKVNYGGTDENGELIDILDWLASGFKTVTSRKGKDSLALMFASGGSGDTEQTALIQTAVNKSETAVNIAANTSIYEIKRDSNGNPVLTEDGKPIYIQDKDTNGNLLYLDEDGNTTTLNTGTIKRKISSQSTSGMYAVTDPNSAESTMFATQTSNGKDLTAAVQTIVKDDTTFINLVADKVRTNGDFSITDFASDDNKILLKKDGSGHLANGNISWDTEGNLRIRGLLYVGNKIMEIVDNVTYTPYVSQDDNGITVHIEINNPNNYVVYVSGYYSIDSMNMMWWCTGMFPQMVVMPNSSADTPIEYIDKNNIGGDYNRNTSIDETSVTLSAWHYVENPEQ